ncbi:hypothetical protein BSKO_06502 [Bryopsis sp. KO-2023]|nr:hypothetical protein BSKO_06502 [Bryopsis sp. KO-2023]
MLRKHLSRNGFLRSCPTTVKRRSLCRCLTSECSRKPRKAQAALPVPTISYDQLATQRDLWEDVDEFMEEVCQTGILSVSGVPGFPALRKELLLAMNDFGDLPEETVRSKYANERSKYAVGWSIGVETFDDRLDVSKGSFFANPFNDNPRCGKTYYPEYHTPNVWPEEVPELEKKFKEMGNMMLEVSLMLAGRIDGYMEAEVPENSGAVSEILRSSQCHKARGLVYFPGDFLNWCGHHNDLCMLTGLVPGLFVEDGEVVANPDTTSGLYIGEPDGFSYRAALDETSMVFQIGETLQALSKGKFKATPHWVAAPVTNPKGIRRTSFAVFFQPDVDFRISDARDEAGWESGMSFGEFARKKLNLCIRS